MKWIVIALVIVSVSMVSVRGFAKKCKSGDDCEEDECCANYVLVSIFGGHCQKMRKEGESCTPLLKDNKEKQDMYHFQCPCKEGLECVAQHEIKIGEYIIRHRPECVVPEEVTEETPFPDPDAE